jgi:hypothetical protein
MQCDAERTARFFGAKNVLCHSLHSYAALSLSLSLSLVPLGCNQPLPPLTGGSGAGAKRNHTPHTVVVRFRASNRVMAYTLGVECVAAYCNAKGEPRTARVRD